MSEVVENEARGAQPSRRRLEKLCGKIRSINFFKVKMITSYGKWDESLLEVVDMLNKIKESLKQFSNTANYVKIGGEISAIVGCVAFICGMLTVNNKNVSDNFERVGKILTVGGKVTAKGSTTVEKVLTKNCCKKAETAVNTLMKITEELEDERKEYFRLVREYETLLDDLSEDELQIIYNYLEENNMENIKNDTDLDSSVENEIPPNTEKMHQLKLDEDVMNVKIFEFNIIPQISEEMRNNPVLKHVLSMKCKSVPFLSGENAIKAVQAVSTLQASSPVVDLIPINSKLGKLKDSVLIEGSAKVALLVDSIFNLALAISNRGEVSEQSQEIGRVVNELEKYRSEVKEILTKALKWDYFEDDSLCIAKENDDKRD